MDVLSDNHSLFEVAKIILGLGAIRVKMEATYIEGHWEVTEVTPI